MEEKRNYVIYVDKGSYQDSIERIIKMTTNQANTIRWFIDNYDIDGTVELAENYEGEEI